jgi:hypothetical protein
MTDNFIISFLIINYFKSYFNLIDIEIQGKSDKLNLEIFSLLSNISLI